jgi:hypothetical protein
LRAHLLPRKPVYRAVVETVVSSGSTTLTFWRYVTVSIGEICGSFSVQQADHLESDKHIWILKARPVFSTFIPEISNRCELMPRDFLIGPSGYQIQ